MQAADKFKFKYMQSYEVRNPIGSKGAQLLSKA